MNSGGARGGLKATIVVLVAVPALVGAFSAAVLLIGRANGVEFWELNEDPVTSLGGLWYTGIYAHIIIVVWQIGAITALFSGGVAWCAGRRNEGRMLLAGGAIGAVMGIDDLFLLHEALQLAGAPNSMLPVVYAGSVVAFTYLFRRALGWWLLLAIGALVGWGASAVIDYVHVGVPLVVEDTPKAVGTVFWSVLLVKLAYRTVSGIVVRADADDESEDLGDSADGAPAQAGTAPPCVAGDDVATTPVSVVPAQRPGSVALPARLEQETMARSAVGGGRQVDGPTAAHAPVRSRHRRPGPDPAGTPEREGAPRHAGGRPSGAHAAPLRAEGRSIVNGHVIGTGASPVGSPAGSRGRNGHDRTSDQAPEPGAHSANRPAEPPPVGGRPGGLRAPEWLADDDVPRSRDGRYRGPG